MTNVITIDGPSGVGKGTISEYLSSQLKWNYLNSGALYRAIAWVARNDLINLDDIKGLKKMGIYFLLLQLVGFLNYLLFLYLINKNEMSYLVPLNQLFVILFSSIIGVLFLKETITPFKAIGIFLVCISIYLINH